MSMKTRMKRAAWIGLLLAAGCNGSVETTPTGSGGNSSTTGGTTGATSSSSTGSGGACAGFEDAQGTAPVTVRFRNDTGMPVYLPGMCEGIDYTIKPTTGDDGVTYNFDSSCLQTCAHLQTEPPFSCGACAERVYLIAPGATRDVVWDGTGLLHGIAMPAACWAEPQGDICSKIVAAPAATYAVQAFGYSSCGAGCTCDDQGVCFGVPEGQQAYADPVKFDFPTKNQVEVVFGVCAFGCAGG